MQKLPIGIQTFSKIREDDYIYIDKTNFIQEIESDADFDSLLNCIWECIGDGI